MPAATNRLVEHFFRHESANLVAVLTRAFGIRRIELIEDMVQAAMLEAMHSWKHRGAPQQPAAWIHRVAKNRIIDALRREKVHDKAIALAGHSATDEASTVENWLEADQLPDSLLRMMFVCCHASLDRKTQIALTLKTLCGFGVSEIARGLLMPAETVKKRLTRAKKSLAAAGLQLEAPTGADLQQRLLVVHDVLYLMFNEGYSTSHGASVIRDDICEEATRLCHLLCESNYATSATKALLSLQLFHASRLEARMSPQGETVLLEDQDRSRWDTGLIMVAQSWFAKSATQQPTTFHLEAAIAMQHCRATSVETTDWPAITRLYTKLLTLNPSPMYKLNRAIAIGQASDTAMAMSELQSLCEMKQMRSYALLDCAIARIHELAGEENAAIDAYLHALSKTAVPHEKQLINRKLLKLTG